LAGPSRFGAIVIVTVLSLLVLGSVWGLVIFLLPQSEGESASSRVAVAPSSQPAPVHNRPVEPAPPPHDPAPVIVREAPPVAEIRPLDRVAPEGPRVPLGLELKCDGEVEALCPEAEGPDRRICLQEKLRQVSGPCQQVLRERLVRMKEAMQQLRVACEADARRFCREAPVGGGAMIQCLEGHAQEVSDRCFELLPKRGRLLN